jgi:aminoglycoside phosphotransferase (APT) family kinase protein
MERRSPAEISKKSKLVRRIIKHHFGIAPQSVKFNPAGLTNYVFEAKTTAGSFIVRIGNSHEKLKDYMKEQWAISNAYNKGVPVAEIVEVGSEIVELPYMIQKKLAGNDSSHHPNRREVLRELGNYTRLIHSIPTSSFGQVFDWSHNRLHRNKTWRNYLNNELDVARRMEVLEKANVLTPMHFKKLQSSVERIKTWKQTPRLNHGDIRLKNVITNKKGKILAIVDWDNCISSVAPYWDFSIALHDLSVDAKQEFLEGYGVHADEFKSMSYALKTFNTLNYVPYIERIIQRRQSGLLAWYKVRLNGYLDLT